MTKILFTLLLSVSAYSQNLITNGDIFPDIDVNKNFIVNPMTLRNLLSVTATTHSLSRNATSPIMGTHDFQITASAAGNVAWTLKPHENFLTGQNCEFKGLYNGGGGTWTAEVFDGTNILNSISLAAVTQVTPFSLTFPCGSGSPTRTVRFRTTASAPQLNVDNLYYGVVTRIGQFSAVSEVIDAGTISIGATTTAPTKGTTTSDRVTYYRVGRFAYITYDYVQTTAGTAGSGDYLYSLPAGLTIDTTHNPIYTGAFNAAAAMNSRLDAFGRQYSAVPQSLNIVYAAPFNSTQFRVAVQNEFTTTSFIGSGLSNLTTASLGVSFTVIVPIAGWSSSVSAAAADQTDYGWTSYTPSTQGLGSPTSIECQHSRISQDLLVRCKLTLGTTTANEMRINFPNNLLAAGTSVIPSIQKCGDASGGGSPGATFFGTSTVLCEPSVGYFTFAVNNNSNNGLTKVNGNIYTSSAAFSFTARIPIAGWEPNQRAPTLIGSVTNDASNAFNQCYFSITNAGTASINLNYGSCVSSVSRSGVGDVTVNFAASKFSGTVIPSCTRNAPGAATTASISYGTVSNTSLQVFTNSGGIGAVDASFSCTVTGPR